MKPNTFSRLYAHCIFCPEGRDSVLTDPARTKIYKYIYGTINGKSCFPLAINGTENHIHILFGFRPSTCIAEIMRDIKRSSSLFINENRLVPGRFRWQDGYGAFTVGYIDLDRVYKYILNQEIHHSKQNFREEYYKILEQEGFENYKNYLFEFYE